MSHIGTCAYEPASPVSCVFKDAGIQRPLMCGARSA